MALSSTTNVLKSETADLRSRSLQLRTSSRELKQRSAECRRRAAETLAGLAWSAPGRKETAPDEYLRRLLRAKADLESAIAECRTALDEVCRELRWRDVAATTVVH